MTRRHRLISTDAATDLAEAQGGLLQPGSGKAARNRYDALFDAIEGLADHPSRYRRLPDDPTRRVIVVKGYRVSPDTGRDRTAGHVTVLAVVGPGEP
jgi:plasmid stabilization system protein ParE